MQFTDEVDWTGSDFLVMGVMLFSACGVFELAAMMTDNTAYRAAVAVAVLGAFLLTWINLAVGIIGSEDNPANLMFFGVLAMGIAGAFVARSRPDGMARTLVAMALAQALIAVIALIDGVGFVNPIWPLTGFFAALWLGSAWLFRRAAREQTPTRAAP